MDALLPLFLVLTILLVVLLVAYIVQHRRLTHLGAAAGIRQMDLDRAHAVTTDLEHRLAEQLDWTHVLLNRAYGMVLIHSVSTQGLPGLFIEANDTACAVLGYSRERLLQMTVFDLEHIEPATLGRAYARVHDGENTVEEIAALVAGTTPETENMVDTRRRMKLVLEDGELDYEQTYVTRDGRHLPVRVHARRCERHGRPLVALTVTDLTKHQETLDALSDSIRFTRDFFAHSAIGVAVYDGERAVTNVNRIALRMFGVQDQEAFAHLNLFESPFLPPGVRDSLARGESLRFEIEMDFDAVRQRRLFVSTRNGRAHYDIVINNLGLDRSYGPKGYLVQILDITHRRQVEEELKERDHKLRQAQKLQAIGTLAGGIAHDFNNILTPVLGYAEMSLDQAAGNETLREYLREIIRASLRAKELASQILTFSRQSEPEGKPIRVIPIVKEVLNLQRAALPKSIDIRRNIESERDIIIGVPSQIHQIMMNLCTNAAHAMRQLGRPGQLEVTVSDYEVGPRPRGHYVNLTPGRYLRVAVRDTGTGIDPAVAERIFEPFFTTKERGEGTGMGLAVVHGIVSSLKGLIYFESEPGQGTTFHVLLPVVEIHSEADAQSEEAIPGGSECILFVDDEVDIVRMHLRLLASLGYRPVATHRSGEALKLFRETPTRYDLVITDQVMPDMSGIDLARQIHSIRSDQPLIMCTGFTDALSAEQAHAFGIREILRKPVTKRQLALAIRRALDESKA